MSSNSVTTVLELMRFQGFDEKAADCASLSSAEAAEGDSGRIGADMKWKPLGVGK